MAEVGVRCIKNLLRKSNPSNESFKCVLSKVLLYYRSTPQSVTKSPPFVLLNNRKYVTVRDRLNPLFSSNSSSNKNHLNSSNKNNLAKNIKQIEVGSHVLALNPGVGPKWRKGIIVGQLGINVYNVYVKEIGVVWKRHLSQLSVIPADCCEESNISAQGNCGVPLMATPDIDPEEHDVFYDAQENMQAIENVPQGQDVPTETILRRSGRERRAPVRYGIDDYRD